MKMKRMRPVIGLIAAIVTSVAAPAAAQTPSGYLSVDQITGTALDANDRSAVVLIHGWTGKALQDAPTDKFAEETDADWFHSVHALSTRLSGTGSKLILFHWENDASTGAAFDGLFDGFGFNNAASAASNAFSNGDRLAVRLNQSAPDLGRVTFVAHSAGAWAAYRAVDKLLKINPYVVVNVVLLDPFIPAVAP